MQESKQENREKNILYIFEGSLFLKGLHAIVEIIGGLLTFFVTQNFLLRTVLNITHNEIVEDPHDRVVTFLIHFVQNFSLSTKYFVAFYLLIHGIINSILVVSLFKKKLWAYPVSIIIFGAFMTYQLERYTRTHSLWLIVFTIFDIIVIWLIWHEYFVQRNNKI